MTYTKVWLYIVTIAVFGIPVHAQAMGDTMKGKETFHQCSACHSITLNENLNGPSLAGVFGRKAGTAIGFNYSRAMRESGITWNENNLEQYIENPQKMFPGSFKTFGGIKDIESRNSLIAYIKSLK